MNRVKLFFIAILALVVSCDDKEVETPTLTGPSNLNISVENVGDGVVNFTASADNASSYFFEFGDGTTGSSTTGVITKTYNMVGDNTFTVVVTASNPFVGSISESIQVAVSLGFSNPETVALLTGGTSKTWFVATAQPGHLGVGPARDGIDGEWWFPKWFSAQAFEKCGEEISDCFCDDELTFTTDGNGSISYVLNNNGSTFFNASHLAAAGGSGDEDTCFEFDTSGSKEVILSPVSGNVPDGETTGIQMDIADGGFLTYYVGSSNYEILSLSENLLYVRTFDSENPDLAWYLRFSSEENTGGGDEPLVTQFNNLVWSDEFDVDGAPDPANWTYDLGAGGWGNNESQRYTDDPSNVIVEDGVLKITARSEAGGSALINYFDDITLLAPSGDVLLEDFEVDAPDFVGFGGSTTEIIANPDPTGENTSATVARSTKSIGSETWAGSFFDIAAPLDLATYETISVKVWSPEVGIPVLLKLENQADTDENVTFSANSTVANQWETLTFDFSSAAPGTYDRVVFFFDFGNTPEGGITSARIKTENLYEFTYGRVEIRAKLPSAGGTWPALWALGANFDQVGWPASGELDILEHVGNNVGRVSSAMHFPGNSGGTAVFGATNVPTSTSEFHNYTMEWTPESIKFVVDDELIHLNFVNSVDTPFNADFFFIMNIAVGGTLGGAIDPAFTEDTMEVDYIRVYQ